MKNRENKGYFEEMGVIASDIICLADSHMKPEAAIIKAADKMREIIGRIHIGILQELYVKYNISLVEYSDMLQEAVHRSEGGAYMAKHCANAICSITTDYMRSDLQRNDMYQGIVEVR